MKRKVFRNEVQSTAANLLDLGFTATAIAFMLNKSLPNIYTHLKKSGRMKGRMFVRQPPGYICDGAQACLRRLFMEPRWINIDILATAQTLLPVTLPASVTKRTSGKSGKKAA